MIIINTVSDNRFTFNGVTYFRNFTPFVTGNKVSIVNAYNTCVSLTDAPTIYSDFVVDGVTYANVNDLQIALLPIVYTRSSLLGFTPENVANKATNLTLPDNTKYPTTLAVSTALSGKQNTLTNPITGTGASGQISFFNGTTTQTSDSVFVWDNTNKRLSIGATTAGARLDVRAQGSLSTDIAFRVRNSANNNDLIRVQGDGNVGIGTTNPLYKLHVVGDLFASTQIIAGTHVYSPNITNPSSANNSQVSLSNSGTRVTRNIADSNTVFGVTNSNASSTGAIQTWSNSAGEVMRVTSTGNVGIGTTTPTSRLHVVGLPSYADNATAIAGGLTVGAFYHTAGILKVVI